MKKKKTLQIDYAVVSVLANLSTEINSITTERPILHAAFYSLREKKYSLFKNVAFETTYYPYSEYVAQAFDNIEMSGLISKANPVMQIFNLNQCALKNFYETEIEPNLSAREIKEIKTIAKNFPALIAS